MLWAWGERGGPPKRPSLSPTKRPFMWDKALQFPLRKFVAFANAFPKWRGYKSWTYKRAAQNIEARLRVELTNGQLSRLASMTPLQRRRFIAAGRHNPNLWKNELLWELYQLMLKYELLTEIYDEPRNNRNRNRWWEGRVA